MRILIYILYHYEVKLDELLCMLFSACFTHFLESAIFKCFDTIASTQCLMIFDKIMDGRMNASVYVQHLKLHSMFINFFLLLT